MKNLVAIAALGAAAACTTGHVAPPAPNNAPAARQPAYDGVVTVSPESSSIAALWTIRLPRRGTALDSVSFYLNKRLRVSQVSGDVASYRDTLRLDFRRLTVLIPPGDANTFASIQIGYSGVIGVEDDNINGVTPQWVELGLDSFWLPVVDDFVHTITGTVRIALPPGWTIASSGTVSSSAGVHTLTQTVPLIDIAFSASPAFKVAESARGRVYFVNARDSTVSRVTSTAQRCGDYLDARYGQPRALPPLRIVVAPRPGPGYARTNYIVITPTAEMSASGLTRFLCHEVAHFWSTGAIASGPDNWLNEGFAEFVSARAVRDLLGQVAYDSVAAQWQRNAEGQPAIWTGPTGRRPGPRVSYSKAPFLLHRLEGRIGAATMDTLLRRFLTEPIRTTPGVVELVRAVAGEAEANWLLEELGKA
jgi:hypothetical protein